MKFILGGLLGSAITFVIASNSLDDEDYNNSSKLLGYAIIPVLISVFLVAIIKLK